jgi:class 3 adenylate cyclase
VTFGGIGVHIAARVLAQAGAGEIVVTGAVRDTARGSPFAFRSRGEVMLRGIGQLELLDAERSRPGTR